MMSFFRIAYEIFALISLLNELFRRGGGGGGVTIESCATFGYKAEVIGPWEIQICICNLNLLIFKLISRVGILNFSFEITLRWIAQDLTEDWFTLV